MSRVTYVNASRHIHDQVTCLNRQGTNMHESDTLHMLVLSLERVRRRMQCSRTAQIYTFYWHTRTYTLPGAGTNSASEPTSQNMCASKWLLGHSSTLPISSMFYDKKREFRSRQFHSRVFLGIQKATMFKKHKTS